MVGIECSNRLTFECWFSLSRKVTFVHHVKRSGNIVAYPHEVLLFAICDAS